ncbi:hypothetical protein PENDEC_c031G04877 [Penicillium decumbens]|uniref:C2H2-type domain-containing protein n=1 Tax=Penicillium decumbens TaxID=69771 RepID=A0A1V6NVS2_PENDC|nr:hypothetical protein PENDEC_c031G04877 [Penicillium decumbens]
MTTDELNSSDLDFGPPTTKRRRLGEASIKSIIENAETDRIKSKRVVKNLEFGHGAPTTRNAQDLWVSRMEVFRKATLKHDVTTPFIGDDLLRLFHSIIGKMKTPTDQVSAKTIVRAYRILCAYGEFEWQDFRITKQDIARFQSFVDDKCRDGSLFRGTLKPKTWLGFATLSRMVRAFLDHNRDNGTQNWDVVVAKCLSITLLGALGVRAGDIARARGYSDRHCLQWRHILLSIDSSRPATNNPLDRIVAHITISFAKGTKDLLNTDTTHIIRPLEDADEAHMCPIGWLLVQALRHGLVEGRTVDDIINQALDNPGKAIKWLQPEYPVLSVYITDPHYGCDLSRPAKPGQLLNTIGEMGIISGILSRVYSHATRYGLARDTAFLPKDSDTPAGFTTDKQRQILGHSINSANRGTTQMYVGDHTQDVWNARAKNKGQQHSKEPKFSTESPIDIIKAPITAEEVQRYEEEHPAAARQLSRKSLWMRIRQQRLAKWKEQTEPDTASSRNNDDTLEHRQDVNDLAMFITGQDNQSSDDRAQDMSFLESYEGEQSDNTMTLPEFISFYSRINVISGHPFYRPWSKLQKDPLSTDVDLTFWSGNSRDTPTPFMYRCTVTAGCDYQTPALSTLNRHKSTCTDELLQKRQRRSEASAAQPYPCPHQGCEAIFPNNKSLKCHIHRSHEWLPKACQRDGCDPALMYTTYAAWHNHDNSHRRTEWVPRLCPVEDCGSMKVKKGTLWNWRGALLRHLKQFHYMDDASANALIA